MAMVAAALVVLVSLPLAPTLSLKLALKLELVRVGGVVGVRE
jgi:hypothetical protein